MYAFKNYGVTRSSRMLLLSFTLLMVGTLDLFHTLSFKGMPYFITESSIAKATWFWVTSRFIQSVLILAILLIPDRKLKRDYRFVVFFLGFVISIAIGFLIIYFEKSLPLLVVEGKGTTMLKNGIEYVVSFIQFASLIITLYQYYLEKSETKLSLALAFVYLLLAELVFTIYQSIFDLDNFLGHIFKAFGFYYILRSFYFSSSSHDDNRLDNHQLLSELPGFIFIVIKRDNEFILTYCTGELLQNISFDQEEMVGMSLSEVFATDNMTMNEYCRFSWRLQEAVTFEIDYMDKSRVISIKPSVDRDENKVLIGTIIEMIGIHQQPTSAKVGTKRKMSK
ncbi:MAG: hypothetical protein K6T88_02660 [Bacillus sp. (in: Bacteria)]|nr:hypothetical protein [Bacillus sp. (in: firmicutes)]